MAALVAAAAGRLHRRARLRRVPAVDAPAAWRIDYPKAADVANTKWWEQFGDPVLNELIETALRENRDVRIAAARVDQFLGALHEHALAALSAGRLRRRREPIAREPRRACRRCRPASTPTSRSTRPRSARRGRLDLFGRVRRLTEAAQAQVYASEQGQRGVVLTRGRRAWRRATSRCARSTGSSRSRRRPRANFGETARIFELRFKRGIVSQTEVSQIESQYQQALAAIPGDRAGRSRRRKT